MRPAFPLAELRDEDAVGVEIGAAKVLLVRLGDAVHAVTRICSHAQVELAEGPLAPGCLIECPMHGAMFEPADGSVAEGPARKPLKTYPTEVVDGTVMVDVGEDEEEREAVSRPTVPGARPSLSDWGMGS
jgi:3-phenylpropionate/trans-cinnamate dioxygenase ferredoxin subunit